MPELRGLDGVKGALPLKYVGTIESAVRALSQFRWVTAAGTFGAVNVWRDDAGRLRSNFCRYRVTVASATHANQRELRGWLKEWWPKMERRERA